MTPSLSRSSAGFYEERHLVAPRRELIPSSDREFRENLARLRAAGTLWQILGDGQHVRTKDDGGRTVLRTSSLQRVLDIDQKSGLIRVQAGMTWKGFREALREEGLSSQRYGLHPATATLGGLLARVRPGPSALSEADLLGGCVAIGAHAPEAGDYRYLVAPRKASGPDLRYRFIGNQGEEGVILYATFIGWRPVAQRLLRWNDTSLAEAAHIMAALFEVGLRPTGLHFSHKRQTLQIFLTAPGQLLRSRIRWISNTLGAPDEIGDEEVIKTRRDWLEARHPDRRSHPQARRTRVFWLAGAALHQAPETLVGEDISEIEIVSWNAQRAEVFVRYQSALTKKTMRTPCANSSWADWPLIPTRHTRSTS